MLLLSSESFNNYLVKSYEIAIYGEMLKNGTEDNEADQSILEYVYLNIFGKISDSGERKVLLGDRNKDDQNQDVLGNYIIKAASIGEINKLVLRLMDSTPCK